MDYKKRIEFIQERLPQDCAYFTYGQIDIFYLTGVSFYKDCGLLILPGKSFIIADSRYRLELLSVAKICEAVEIEHTLLDTIKRLLPVKIKRVFVSGNVNLSIFQKLLALRGKEFAWGKDVDGLISSMRMVKSKDEIRVVKMAIGRHRSLFSLWKEKIVGLSELDAAVLWRRLLLEKNLQVSFEPIVALQEGASCPHYVPSNRKKISGKRFVLADMGLCYQGYMTDLTRILFADRIERRYKFLFTLVEEAQNLAVSSIRPGVAVKDVVHKVNRFFEREGVRQYFLHGLGHGVGLEVHERPFLSVRSEDIFEEGMVFTIEPGLYIQPKVGVRLEDMFLVKKDGVELLSEDVK